MKRILRQHYSHQSDQAKVGVVIWRLAILIILLLVYNMVVAESASGQTYVATQGEVFIVGTANTRSWGLEAQDLDCRADIKVSEKNNLLSVSSLVFTVQVKDLKGQNIWMNRGVYKALKGYPFDKIRFKGVYFKTNTVGNNKYIIKAEGNLDIAGINKVTSLTVDATVNPDGSITCTGSKAISMSDFHVQIAPSEKKRMNIGDEVILTFAIVLVQND